MVQRDGDADGRPTRGEAAVVRPRVETPAPLTTAWMGRTGSVRTAPLDDTPVAPASRLTSTMRNDARETDIIDRRPAPLPFRPRSHPTAPPSARVSSPCASGTSLR